MLSTSLLVGSTAGEGDLFAIVVGYNESRVSLNATLRYADDDALQYARTFEDLGGEVRLLVELDDESRRLHPVPPEHREPTRANIAAAFSEFERWRQGRAKSTLYFVYAGHGDVERGEGSLSLKDGAMPRSVFYAEVLDRASADVNHVIIDACKSYFMVFDRSLDGERFHYDQPFAQADILERWPRVGFFLSTSSAKNSHEWEALQAGVFSYELRSAMRGAADADGDEEVSYAEAFAFVRTANQRVRNLKFVPEVMAVPPRSRAPLVRLGGKRRLTIDRSLGHRLSIEDVDGIRIADLRNGFESKLLLPDTITYVLDVDRGTEYRIPALSVARLSRRRPQRPRVAPRGAAHAAFEQLFAEPFTPSAAENVNMGLGLAPTRAKSEVLSPPKVSAWAWAGVGVATALAATGTTLRLYANERYEEYRVTPTSSERDALRDRIEITDDLAWVAFGSAAATALTTLLLYEFGVLER